MDGARTGEHRCNAVSRLEPRESSRFAANFTERIPSHGVSEAHKNLGQVASEAAEKLEDRLNA